MPYFAPFPRYSLRHVQYRYIWLPLLRSIPDGRALAATIDVLQRAQNNLARVVCQKRDRTDARPLLRSLHWLPIKQRITHKMATSTFTVMSTSTPAYLSDLIQPAAPARPLRSSVAPLYWLFHECELNLLDEHSRSWHHKHGTLCLHADIRSCHSLQTFKRNLKTHLFTQS